MTYRYACRIFYSEMTFKTLTEFMIEMKNNCIIFIFILTLKNTFYLPILQL